MARPFVVGIVGGVASGKSFVAGLFRDLGARVEDADAAAKAVLDEPEVREALAEAYGAGVLDADGSVDRLALADAAFGPPPETGPLNRIVHPRVRRRLEKEVFAGTGVVVLDAPLLLEAGLAAVCDLVVYVEADEAVRAGRARARGWSEAEWRRREASQADAGEKRAAAHVTVFNGGALEETRAQVRAVYDRFVAPRASGADRKTTEETTDEA